MSYFSLRNFSSASTPFFTRVRLYLKRMCCTKEKLLSLSSAISTLKSFLLISLNEGICWTGTGVAGAFSISCISPFSCVSILQGIHAQKVEPMPGLEVKPISPPAPSMIALEIASPSPVPCANSLSFWKRPNTLSCNSTGIPTPESCT